MAANPCGKRVTPENAYEVWESDWRQPGDGLVKTYVLKKYQTPEQEAKNPWAKWYCATSSPGTMHRLEYGDAYVSSVTSGARKLSVNPLTGKPIGGGSEIPTENQAG